MIQSHLRNKLQKSSSSFSGLLYCRFTTFFFCFQLSIPLNLLLPFLLQDTLHIYWKYLIFTLKITNVNSYNENHRNPFAQFAKTVRHVMTIDVTDPGAWNPLDTAATLPDLSHKAKTPHT